CHHQAVENPYTRIGDQDMTAHVNFSDLIDEGTEASLEAVRFTTQMDYLVGLGVLDEIAQLANAGDAASIDPLIKIKRLILPGSMGERFKVLVQTKRGHAPIRRNRRSHRRHQLETEENRLLGRLPPYAQRSRPPRRRCFLHWPSLCSDRFADPQCGLVRTGQCRAGPLRRFRRRYSSDLPRSRRSR